MERYSRNRIYVSEEEQERIKQVRILLGGAGIGSIIAECALRFGFENITIVDGDKVAGHCVNAMFNLATGKEVKCFPKFYFSSLMCEKDSFR